MKNIFKSSNVRSVFKLKNGETGCFIQLYNKSTAQVKINDFYLFYDLNGKTQNRYYHEYDIVKEIKIWEQRN